MYWNMQHGAKSNGVGQGSNRNLQACLSPARKSRDARCKGARAQ